MGRAPPPPETADSQESAVLNGIDQYELQRSIITRLVKSSLPAEVKLQKEVAGALSKCSTVFISYLAAGAHDNAVARAVKTISAQDVIGSLAGADLWPEELAELLEDQLEAYRTYGPRRPEPRSKKAAKAAPTSAGSSKPLKIKLSTAGKGKARAEGDAADSADGAEGAERTEGVRSEEDDEEEDEDDDDDEDEDDDDEDEDEEDGDGGAERMHVD